MLEQQGQPEQPGQQEQQGTTGTTGTVGAAGTTGATGQPGKSARIIPFYEETVNFGFFRNLNTSQNCFVKRLAPEAVGT